MTQEKKSVDIYIRASKLWETATKYKMAWVCFTGEGEFVGVFLQLGSFTRAVIGAKICCDPKGIRFLVT